MLMELVLSHWSGTWVYSSPKSLMVYEIQRSWEQQLAAATYSASIVDWATLDCLREDQDTCWRLIVVSNFVYDLQADKSLVVVKGPFFPRVVNPGYRILGTNVWRKSWSSKAK
jgi:hypothetical protein